MLVQLKRLQSNICLTSASAANSLLSQVLLKGPKEMGNTRPRTSNWTCELSWRYDLAAPHSNKKKNTG